MMSLTFGLFTQVSGSGPLGPLVYYLVLGRFLTKAWVGGGNKNKNKMTKIPSRNKKKIKASKMDFFFIFQNPLILIGCAWH